MARESSDRLTKRPSRPSSGEFDELLEASEIENSREQMKKPRCAKGVRRSRKQLGSFGSSSSELCDLPSQLHRSPSGSSYQHARSYRWTKVISGLLLGLVFAYLILRSTHWEEAGLQKLSGMVYATNSDNVKTEHRKMMDSNGFGDFPGSVKSHPYEDAEKTSERDNKVSHQKHADKKAQVVAKNGEANSHKVNSLAIAEVSQANTRPGVLQDQSLSKVSDLGRKGIQMDRSEGKQDTKSDTDRETNEIQESQAETDAVDDQVKKAKKDAGWKDRSSLDPLLAAFMGGAADAVTVSGVIDPHAGPKLSLAKQTALKNAIAKESRTAAEQLLEDQAVAEKGLKKDQQAAEAKLQASGLEVTSPPSQPEESKQNLNSADKSQAEREAAQKLKDERDRAQRQEEAERRQKEAEQHLKTQQEIETQREEDLARKAKEEKEAKQRKEQEAAALREKERMENWAREKEEEVKREMEGQGKLQQTNEIKVQESTLDALRAEKLQKIEELKQLVESLTVEEKQMPQKTQGDTLKESESTRTGAAISEGDEKRQHDLSVAAQEEFLKRLAVEEANLQAEISRVTDEQQARMNEEDFWKSEAGIEKAKEQAAHSAKQQADFMREQQEKMAELEQEIAAANNKAALALESRTS